METKKIIQALFLELKLEDEHTAPAFVRVWNRAQIPKGTERQRVKVFVLATISVVIALSSLALWLGNRDRSKQSNPIMVVGQPTTSESNMAPLKSGVEGLQEVNRGRRNRKARRSARQSGMMAFKQDEILKATSISSWQSPTAGLMQSPAQGVLTSLPPLDQHVQEMNSFLQNRQK